MTKWTSEQKQLFEYLVDYVTDNATAGVIVNGGELGFLYGRGGYMVIDNSEQSQEFYKEQCEAGGYSVDLDGTTYLIGSQI